MIQELCHHLCQLILMKSSNWIWRRIEKWIWHQECLQRPWQEPFGGGKGLKS